MAVTRDVLEAIHQRRSGSNPGSDLLATVDSFALTPAESSAGVTPVNYAYPPLYPERYGTNTTPGTTDMIAAINAAVKVAKTSGNSKVVLGTTWPYLVTAPIDCTWDGATGGNYPFVIEWVGNIFGAGILTPNFPAILIAKHTGVIFDCTGAISITFVHPSIGTDPTVNPSICFLLARNSTNASQIVRIIEGRVIGYFTDTVYYNYGSEDDVLQSCYFMNLRNPGSPASGTSVLEYTGTNVRGITSTFVTIATGAQSCIDHQVIGGQFLNSNTDNATTNALAGADVIRTEATDDLKILYPWMECAGRAYLYADLSTAEFSSRFRLFGLQGENGTGNLYGIVVSNPAALNDLVASWTIDSCYLPNTTAAIKALGTNATIDGWTVRNLTDNSASPGKILIPGLALGCMFDLTAANAITLGTSEANKIIAQTNNTTITTRTSDSIDDVTITNTVTLNLSALTLTGGVVGATIAYHGRLVTVCINISGQSALSATAGAQITGLPALATPKVASAQVQLWDITGNVSLGQGAVSATGITMPTFNAGTHAVAITATYFAS